MAPASVLSLLIRSSTVSTVMPAFLVGGSLTEVTTLRGSRSMPRVVASIVSMGFFFACGCAEKWEWVDDDHRAIAFPPSGLRKLVTFMMLGRVAYLGSLRRRSAVTTEGVLSCSFSVPASVSRSTLRLCQDT